MLLYEDITYDIRRTIFNVYNYWGPGLLEQIYEESLTIELEMMGHKVERQVDMSLTYKEKALSCKFRADLVVDDLIIIELKSVDELHPIHFKQLQTYLRLTNKRLGILVNFNCVDIQHNIKRVIVG